MSADLTVPPPMPEPDGWQYWHKVDSLKLATVTVRMDQTLAGADEYDEKALISVAKVAARDAIWSERIASLQARLEAAERDAARGRQALGALMTWLGHNLPMDVWMRTRQKDEWAAAESVLRDHLKPIAAIDAATQEKPQ